MPLISATQMTLVEQQKKDRAQQLQQLIRQPFNILNDVQLNALTQRLNHFELSLNRMYVLQSMAELMKVWGGSWLWALVLPIPDSARILLNYTLYLGVSGMMLSQYSMDDFHQEFQEMQQLYNWAVKNSADEKNFDNAATLRNPDIQRMIQLLAPLSTREFMIAWEPVSEQKVNDEYMLTKAVKWGASWFSPPPKPLDLSADAKIRALKARVERGELNTGIIDGLKSAGEYFITNPHFQQIASEQAVLMAQKPFEMLKEAVPNILSASARPHSQ